MNSQQVLDRRKHLVDTGVIHEMNLGGINLGYEWSAMEPDQTDERVHQHMDRLARLSGDAGSPRIVLDLGCAHGARSHTSMQISVHWKPLISGANNLPLSIVPKYCIS